MSEEAKAKANAKAIGEIGVIIKTVTPFIGKEKGASDTGVTKKTENGKQYVSLGLIVLGAVLIVIVIFIVMKCKLRCNKNT